MRLLKDNKSGLSAGNKRSLVTILIVLWNIGALLCWYVYFDFLHAFMGDPIYLSYILLPPLIPLFIVSAYLLWLDWRCLIDWNGTLTNTIRIFTSRNIAKNKSGLIWVWAVCLLAISVFAMAYFVLGMPAMMVIEAVESQYEFPAEAQATLGLFKLVFAWVGVIFLVGMLIWAITNSRKKEYLSYDQ